MPSDTTIGLVLLGITLVLLVLVLILWVRLVRTKGEQWDAGWSVGYDAGYDQGHTDGYTQGYKAAQVASNERALEAAFVRGQQNMAKRMYEIFDTADTKSFDIMEAALDAAAELIDDTKNEEEKPDE